MLNLLGALIPPVTMMAAVLVALAVLGEIFGERIDW